MTWLATKNDEIINSLLSGSEVGRAAIIVSPPQYYIARSVAHSGNVCLSSLATIRDFEPIFYWRGASYTNQIETEPEQPIEQLDWDDVEGMKAYAAEFREEELGLANAGLNSYTQKLAELDNI